MRGVLIAEKLGELPGGRVNRVFFGAGDRFKQPGHRNSQCFRRFLYGFKARLPALGFHAAVYLVGVDGDKDLLARFAAKHKIPFPVLWDPKGKTMGRKYDLMRGAFLVVPKTYIISPAGKIEYAAESYDETRKAALNAKLASLSGKKWDKPSEVAV